MRLPADQRRRQLLDVARDAFAESGFHATSMDEIALAAGVTKPVLYQHFGSKRDMYTELLDDVGTQLLDQLGRATASATTGREQVEEGFAAYFRFVGANQSAFRLLFGASVRNDAEFAVIAERTVRAAAEAISSLIAVPAPPEQRRVLANALAAMAEATSRRMLVDPGAENDPDALARWIAELAWFGLRGVRSDDETTTVSPSRATPG